MVRLGDVARVELGADTYAIASLFNGHPAAGIAIMLAPGANALKTVDAVKAKAEELAAQPAARHEAGLSRSTTPPSSASRSRTWSMTLIEAIALVVLVMYIFLQNWRATLIPAIAVPVVLLGTFGVLAVFGYSINTLTLFALVLVIGLLVDDAIVVVENVERIMHEEGLSPREATLKSMEEITGALIGIGLVLTAVFLPMAFFGGSTGVIYRQFSITIVSAMSLSIMVALVLSPVALRHPAQAGGRRGRPHEAGRLLRLVQPQLRRIPRLVSARTLGWILQPRLARPCSSMPASWRCWRCCSCACPPAFCPTRTRASSST